MRLLANENVPGEAVEAMRHHDHEVLWVRTDAPGSKDWQILARAQAEDRIILTFEKDFGELAFHQGLPAQSGVILFRISAQSAAYVAQVAIAALETREDWSGHFSVIEDGRIHMTPLPA